MGSLRQAILYANANVGADTIEFSIPASDLNFVDVDSALAGGDAAADAFVIKPLTQLPTLDDTTGGTTIDGRTQASFGGDTNPSGPEIILDGSMAGIGVHGVQIASDNNRVFGLNVHAFDGSGIRINSGDNNWLAGNYIGTDATGTLALGNVGRGVTISGGQFNVIGTDGDDFADAAERNIISGNVGEGIAILGTASNTIVAGNYIGTDATGTLPLGNGETGVDIRLGSSFNRIGTNGDGVADVAERNIISANGTGGTQGNGVEIGSGIFGAPTGGTEGNIVAGNYIGTDVTGTIDLGNLLHGVSLLGTARSNRIGTDGNGMADAVEGNLLSGNGLGGIGIFGGADLNLVAGNYIGTDASGAAPLPNDIIGVAIGFNAQSNQIGGVGALANVIAFNGGPGVGLGKNPPFVPPGPDATGNRIQGNSIHSNAGLGIDLNIQTDFTPFPPLVNLISDGVTPNDFEDADTGDNNLQNFPVIAAAAVTASTGTTTISGSLATTPSPTGTTRTYRVEFFANQLADPSGHGEGETFLGFADVEVDDTGSGAFSAAFPSPAAAVVAGHLVTATATDPDGNTSEFSAAVSLIPLETTDLQEVVDAVDMGQTVDADVEPDKLDQWIAAVEALTVDPPLPGEDPVEIVFNLGPGTYQVQEIINVPAGIRLVISGDDGDVVFEGSSPALVVNSGEVLVIGGVTFENATDFPTILVTGGTLTIRDSTIVETSGGDQAAIQITGGAVDLGTSLDAGGNTIVVSGPGEAIRNLGAAPVSAIGNTFQQDASTITSNFAIEDEVFHALDVGGGGLVTYVADNVFVTIDEDNVFAIDLETLTADLAPSGLGFAIAGGTNGAAILLPDGKTAQFTPDANFNGAAQFSYTASEMAMTLATRTVNFSITPINDNPFVVAPIADVQVVQDAPNTVIDLSSVFDDVDILTNGDILTLTVAGNTNPTLLTASLMGTTLTLDYAAGQFGTAEITIRATDLAGAFAEDTLLVTVNPTPSEMIGMVWEDFNNNGEVDFNEKAIEGVTITLTGTDDRGNAVNESTSTDVDGIYMFFDLRPGDYTLSETQPGDFNDGQDTLGTVNGLPIGDNTVNDVFSGIVLDRPDSVAQNYNFGERPLVEGQVSAGQTATIGFWQNKNGQELIASVSGQLAEWLSVTFVNMYGANAGSNDLSGMTNVQVADFYSDLFRRKKKEAAQLGLGGPAKMDAQIMAVALATYVTNENLAGTVAASYGFLVTENGVGVSTFNVGDSGEAFDVADNSELSILDLLFATNALSVDGVLYDMDGDGDADDSFETLLRTLANDVYSAINEAGDI